MPLPKWNTIHGFQKSPDRSCRDHHEFLLSLTQRLANSSQSVPKMIIIFFGKTQSTQNDAHETNQTAQPPQLSHTKQFVDAPTARHSRNPFSVGTIQYSSSRDARSRSPSNRYSMKHRQKGTRYIDGPCQEVHKELGSMARQPARRYKENEPDVVLIARPNNLRVILIS